MVNKRVLVAGGGIAGVQAALDMAEMNIEVYLVERGPSIGGRMAQLDKTFPTNDCSMCILSPKLVEAAGHPYIKLITNTEVLDISGEAPRFTATLLKHPRYVDEEKCTGCGLCTTKCPVKIPDIFNKGMNDTKCIRLPFAQAVPAVALIDPEKCIYLTRGKCGNCVKVCDAKAIDFEQKPEEISVECGAVVLAPGSLEFEANRKPEYGYRTFPNVITSIEMERLLSATGPTGGHITRPSDGKEPHRIAFIQCVGSRDSRLGNPYCSSICCMQAAKHAVILGEHLDDCSSTIFFMDLRAFSKGFDRYVEQTGEEKETKIMPLATPASASGRVSSETLMMAYAEKIGCQFIRSRVSSVEADPKTDNLKISYYEDGAGPREMEFDMVVLSVGLVNGSEQRQWLKSLDIPIDEYGFVRTVDFDPVATLRPGIFTCGTLSTPKDIPESVVEASAAAAAAASVVVGQTSKEINFNYPLERDIRGEPPRVGVFVCNCGINIGSVVDVPAVAEYAGTLPNVVHAQEFLFSCSQDSQAAISDMIREKNLNRVVVAACTPRTHEPLFQKTLLKSGLNPYLFEFVNIREQCSWVHQKQPEAATTKAMDLVRMGITKARRLQPLKRMSLNVARSALVIGGGPAGMTAAAELAAQDYPVHIVEKENELGGNLRHVHFTYDGGDTDEFLAHLEEKIRSDPKITLHLGVKAESIDGFVGNFKTTLSDGEIVEHGVVIIATGGEEITPKEYSYGEDDRVATLRQLEARIAAGDPELKKLHSVVMIQCVGSRNDEHPYCSRVCCAGAVKNALKLKEINPRAEVYVLYRDMRTYGFRELQYQKAREKGVIFSRFDKHSPPEVLKEGGKLLVTMPDLVLRERIVWEPDLVILSAGIMAGQENKVLSQMLKVPLDQDNFFLEAHVKLRPVDFATEGVFVCGLAHYPKDLYESIAQAKAAAGRSATVLSKVSIEAEGKVSTVNTARCSGCGACVEVCAYNALSLDEETGKASVNEALCKGCGVCAATCKTGAIDLLGFQDAQILEVLEVM